MTSPTVYTSMPPRGAEGTPIFELSHPRALPRYLSELTILFDQYKVTSDQDKKGHAVRYLDFDTWELWQCLPEFSDPSKSFTDFTRALYDLYPGCLDDERHSFQELELFVQNSARNGINSTSDLGAYHGTFNMISTTLIRQHRLSDLEQKRFYIQGFHPSLQTLILDRLQLKNLDRLPDIPYDIPEVFQAAKFILISRNLSQQATSISSPPPSSPSFPAASPSSQSISDNSNVVDTPIQSFLTSLPVYPPGLPIIPSKPRSPAVDIESTVQECAKSIVQAITSSIPAPELVPKPPDIPRTPPVALPVASPSLSADDRISEIQEEIQRLERLKDLERQVSSLKSTQERKNNRSHAAFLKELEARQASQSILTVSTFSLDKTSPDSSSSLEIVAKPSPYASDTVPLVSPSSGFLNSVYISPIVSHTPPIDTPSFPLQEQVLSLEIAKDTPHTSASTLSVTPHSVPSTPESVLTPNVFPFDSSISSTPPVTPYSMLSTPSSVLLPKPLIFDSAISKHTPSSSFPSVASSKDLRPLLFIFSSLYPILVFLCSFLDSSIRSPSLFSNLFDTSSIPRGPPRFPIRKAR